MTITDAVSQVMRAHGVPMTAEEAYRAIVSANLYEFHSDNPGAIVRSQIRRHCEGLDFPSASARKHFALVGDSRYVPLAKIIRVPKVSRKARITKTKTILKKSLIEQLQELHREHIIELEARVLRELKRLSPAAFEQFAKRLLDVYGFHGTEVTSISGDGGIDGFGKLRVGLANLNVAFQCKRWTKGNIQRPEIDKFRGASQGDFEQGLFFTTSSFSSGAIQASIKRGAIPIILIDGPMIVQLMIDKKFGVQVETLSIPTFALDLALENEESM